MDSSLFGAQHPALGGYFERRIFRCALRCALAISLLTSSFVSGCHDAGPGSPDTSAMSSVRLETSPERLEHLTIGSTSRLVLREPQQQFEVTIPSDAALEVGFGVANPVWAKVEEVEFVVSFRSGDENRVVFSEKKTRPAAGQNDWSEVTSSLSALAGRRGTLAFDAHVTRGKGPTKGIVWTNPQLSSAASAAKDEALNLVLVSIDTLRADHLGSYGYDKQTSPNIDRMAQAGILFRQATAASSWTLPSHASLFSGLVPSRHGARLGFATPIPPEVRMLAEPLWAAGYDTAAFTDGLFVSGSLGFERGFNRYFVHPLLTGTADNFEFAAENFDHAMQWMARRQNRPFFVFLHTYEVHMPYSPPAPYDVMFDPDYQGQFARQFTLADLDTLRSAGGQLDARTVTHLEALYDGEIRHVDESVGKLLDFLATSGLAKKTCLMLISDHGDEFEEHGGLLHDNAKLYQELVHVPLIVWCPAKFPRARIVEEPVGLVDVMPTLLDLAGLSVPVDIDGRSLRGALEGGALPGDRALLSEVDGAAMKHEGTTSALRRARYKLIRSSLDGSQLFDLRDDPGETTDVSAAQAQVTSELGSILDDLQRRPPVANAKPLPASQPSEATQERLRALGYVLPE